MAINLLSTLQGSLLEGFFPAGWDLAKIDACCDHPPEAVTDRQPWWNAASSPSPATPGPTSTPCSATRSRSRSG